jgi:hypothetical protein
MRARPISLATIAALAITVGACGGNAGPGDFADEAEDFIEGDLADNPAVSGLTFTDAQCDEPASTDVGTTYNCVAVGSDGQTYTFGVSIDGERSLQVVSFNPVTDGTTTTTTASPTTTTTG